MQSDPLRQGFAKIGIEDLEANISQFLADSKKQVEIGNVEYCF